MEHSSVECIRDRWLNPARVEAINEDALFLEKTIVVGFGCSR